MSFANTLPWDLKVPPLIVTTAPVLEAFIQASVLPLLSIVPPFIMTCPSAPLPLIGPNTCIVVEVKSLLLLFTICPLSKVNVAGDDTH